MCDLRQATRTACTSISGAPRQVCIASCRWTGRRWRGKSASAGSARPRPRSATGALCTYLTRWGQVNSELTAYGWERVRSWLQAARNCRVAAICLTTLCVAAGTWRAHSGRLRQRLQRPPLRWLRSAGPRRARCCSTSSGRQWGLPPGGRTRARMCGTERAMKCVFFLPIVYHIHNAAGCG